jgi:hypothetical protein
MKVQLPTVTAQELETVITVVETCNLTNMITANVLSTGPEMHVTHGPVIVIQFVTLVMDLTPVIVMLVL